MGLIYGFLNCRMPGCRAAIFGCPATVDEFHAVVSYDVWASVSSTEPALPLIANAGRSRRPGLRGPAAPAATRARARPRPASFT
jgi:hypothetical protein